MCEIVRARASGGVGAHTGGGCFVPQTKYPTACDLEATRSAHPNKEGRRCPYTASYMGVSWAIQTLLAVSSLGCGLQAFSLPILSPAARISPDSIFCLSFRRAHTTSRWTELEAQMTIPVPAQDDKLSQITWIVSPTPEITMLFGPFIAAILTCEL